MIPPKWQKKIKARMPALQEKLQRRSRQGAEVTNAGMTPGEKRKRAMLGGMATFELYGRVYMQQIGRRGGFKRQELRRGKTQ